MTPFFVLDKFLDFLQKEKRYAVHTITAYEKDISQFLHFAELKESAEFSEVQSKLVRAWVVSLIEAKISNKSVNRKLSALRTFYKFLNLEEITNENPLRKVKAPKSQKRLPSFVKENEILDSKTDHLFSEDFNGLRDKLIFELFYQCGIRLSELINLKDSDCSSETIRVLGKRNKERIVPISHNLHNLIQQFRALKKAEEIYHENLLVLKNGNILSAKFVYRKINSYLSSITNLEKKSPHVLRHTFATHLLNNGAGLETLKNLLGHANLSATQIYTHNSFKEISNIYSQSHPRGAKKN